MPGVRRGGRGEAPRPVAIRPRPPPGRNTARRPRTTARRPYAKGVRGFHVKQGSAPARTRTRTHANAPACPCPRTYARERTPTYARPASVFGLPTSLLLWLPTHLPRWCCTLLLHPTTSAEAANGIRPSENDPWLFISRAFLPVKRESANIFHTPTLPGLDPLDGGSRACYTLRMVGETPVVVPSSLRMHTELLPRLIEKNPPLAQDVVNALNRLDRSRNRLFRQVLGDIKPLRAI